MERKIRERFYFSEEQDMFIKEHYKGIGNAELTQMFNKKFGLDLPISVIKRRKNKYGFDSGLTGHFVKGQISFNKGLKQSDYMSPEAIERTKATRFKPGQCPINHKEVGSRRISVDGYIEIKVAEPGEWELEHIVVWQSVHGPIKKGHCLIHLDGDSTNNDLDNLKEIKRVELLRLNQSGLYSKNKDINEAAINLAIFNAKMHEKVKKING